ATPRPRAFPPLALCLCLCCIAAPARAGCLTVTAPNGGETLLLGTAAAITWTSTCAPGTRVRVVLRKNGAYVGDIAADVPAAPGSFTWQAGRYQGGTAPAGSGYRIRVKTLDGSAFDDSNAGFSLHMQAATVSATASLPVDLELENILSGACPYGPTLAGVDAFYMNDLKVHVRNRSQSTVKEFRVRVTYYDLARQRNEVVTRDVKALGPGEERIVDLVRAPVLVRAATGIRGAVVPLGRLVDPDMSNNTLGVRRCNTRVTSGTGRPAGSVIQDILGR
ncbi:hypothetical protein G3N55_12380, partial [Dissulfurirhabdus thermomarina]|nr:hypothetical protein [Dissulfurirhabdus thermomarina]